MLDNRLSILHVSNLYDTLERDIFNTLTLNLRGKKGKSRSRNTESAQLVIDNSIYMQKVKRPYSEPPHTCSGLHRLVPWFPLWDNWWGEKNFLKSMKLLKSLIFSFVHRNCFCGSVCLLCVFFSSTGRKGCVFFKKWGTIGGCHKFILSGRPSCVTVRDVDWCKDVKCDFFDCHTE